MQADLQREGLAGAAVCGGIIMVIQGCGVVLVLFCCDVALFEVVMVLFV
jgi:hypothetical protein